MTGENRYEPAVGAAVTMHDIGMLMECFYELARIHAHDKLRRLMLARIEEVFPNLAAALKAEANRG